MNRQYQLLNLLMEECCEVAQAASKCIRFTPEHSYEGVSNLTRLIIEFNDLLSIVELLKEEGIVLEKYDELIKDKKSTLKGYIQFSNYIHGEI